MKTYIHPLLISTVLDLIDRIPVEHSGTYNPQDPTHYERGSIKIAGYKIEYQDVTWGVSLTITYNKKSSTFYYDYQDKMIYVHKEQLSNTIKRLWAVTQTIKLVYPSKQEEYFKQRSLV